MTHPLDGTYQVTTTSSYQGPLQKKSDGVTEIRNSQTERVDDAGCKWTSTFTVLNDHEVEMESHADPTNASIDFALTRQDGSPTRDPVTYKTVLKLQRKDDRIQMSGQIEYGNEVVFITMRKK
jgi:hypothetical protein